MLGINLLEKPAEISIDGTVTTNLPPTAPLTHAKQQDIQAEFITVFTSRYSVPCRTDYY